jgi:uncharacterized membrane protein
VDPTATYSRRAEEYLKGRVAWNLLFRLVSYVRSALWVVPLLSILLVLIVAPMLRWLDAVLGWREARLGLVGAQALCETVITLALSFMVFTFGSLLVAIQVASGQLTPRIIATTLLRDNVVRYSVGLFVFTLVFTVMALDRLDTQTYHLVTLAVAVLGIASIATFLFLIDYAARLLRPVSIVARVGSAGLQAIVDVYGHRATDAPDVTPAYTLPPGPTRVLHHEGTPGIVLAVDRRALVNRARLTNGLIECIPHVGDFLAVDEPILRLHGGATAIDDRTLRGTVAVGTERTMEQDPLFAFRILVDIALKALSPAINDPTTAVLAIDQVHRLLRAVGRRPLHTDLINDSLGHHRLIYHTPNWEDFVNLSCCEIRACGAGSIQIARRLRAMLDNLVATLPEHRHPALVAELRRLDQTIEKLYSLPDDLALARVPDSQGLGAASADQQLARARGARTAHS